MDQKIYEEFEQIKQCLFNFIVKIKQNKTILLDFSMKVLTEGNSFVELRPLKKYNKTFHELQYIEDKAELIAKKYGYKLVINSEITVYGIGCN